MKKTRNPNLVKARHSYTFQEIAEVYKVHLRTVQNWRKKGLEILDETTKPYLVTGGEIKLFLKENKLKHKHPLKPGEFFCTKCKSARKSVPDNIFIEITNKRMGKMAKQVFIKGICEICNTSLFLFSSDRKLKELQEKGVFIKEHKTTINGNGDSSVNTDIIRGEK